MRRGRIERFITSGISPQARAAIGAGAAGPRPAGRDHPRRPDRPRRGHRPGPPAIRVPAPPPRDDLVPRRAGDGQGPLRRQPVPLGQARGRAVLRGRRAPRRDVRGPRGHRHRERPPPRPGPAPRDRRGAGADRQGPPRRDHPGDLRRRPLAGGRPRARGGRGRRARMPSPASTAPSTRSTSSSRTSAPTSCDSGRPRAGRRTPSRPLRAWARSMGCTPSSTSRWTSTAART